MKSLKLFLVSVISASAFVLIASPAKAVLSDSLTMYEPGGAFVAGTSADENEPPGALYSFNHQHSNPAFIGQWIAILNPVTGQISDVVGVANQGGNVFGFMSSDNLTPGQIAAYFASPVPLETLTETAGGITIDSRTDPFLSLFINPADLALGRYVIFQSDGDAPVPDGGSAVALLGIALVGIEGVRRLFQARKTKLC
jgi:hypothetical protein